MKEYIEREAALKAMSQAIQDRTWSMDDFDVMMKMEDYVQELPAADVEPVAHGEWIKIQTIGTTVQWQCSECKHEKMYTHIGEQPNYCPNCGAKMDGGR